MDDGCAPSGILNQDRFPGPGPRRLSAHGAHQLWPASWRQGSARRVAGPLPAEYLVLLQLLLLGLLIVQPGLDQVLSVLQLVDAVLVLTRCQIFLRGGREVALFLGPVRCLRAAPASAVLWPLGPGWGVDSPLVKAAHTRMACFLVAFSKYSECKGN